MSVNWRSWPVGALERQLSSLELSTEALRRYLKISDPPERRIYEREIHAAEECAADIIRAIDEHRQK